MTRDDILCQRLMRLAADRAWHLRDADLTVTRNAAVGDAVVVTPRGVERHDIEPTCAEANGAPFRFSES